MLRFQLPAPARVPPPFEPPLAPDVAFFWWVLAHLPHIYVAGACLAGAGAWWFGARRRFPPPLRRKAAVSVALAWPIVTSLLASIAVWRSIFRYLGRRL